MKKFLGKGFSAFVWGPYTQEELNDMEWGKYLEDLPALCIVRILCRQPDRDNLFWLARGSSSMIVPLDDAPIEISKRIVEHYFNHPDISTKTQFWLELQEYGGIDFFNFMAGLTNARDGILFPIKKYKHYLGIKRDGDCKERTFGRGIESLYRYGISAQELFVGVWSSVIDILLDTHRIIYEHNVVFADIKPENMVIDKDTYRLRLIDIGIYSIEDLKKNASKRCTITPQLDLMPPQAMGMFRPFQYTRKQIRDYQRDVYGNLSICAILQTFRKERKHLSPQSAFYFVLYPLFFLFIRYSDQFDIRQEDPIYRFVVSTIRKRDTIDEDAFYELIVKMRSFLPRYRPIFERLHSVAGMRQRWGGYSKSHAYLAGLQREAHSGTPYVPSTTNPSKLQSLRSYKEKITSTKI